MTMFVTVCVLQTEAVELLPKTRKSLTLLEPSLVTVESTSALVLLEERLLGFMLTVLLRTILLIIYNGPESLQTEAVLCI